MLIGASSLWFLRRLYTAIFEASGRYQEARSHANLDFFAKR